MRQIELTPADHFIVMACDGLWDKLSYEDVVNSVSRLRKEGKSSSEIGKALVQEALDKVSYVKTCSVSRVKLSQSAAKIGNLAFDKQESLHVRFTIKYSFSFGSN